MSSDRVSAQNVEQFLSGKLAQVDVISLERELRELWTSATASSTEDQRRAVARACVLNLILYSCDFDLEATAANLLDEITFRHPCRALLALSYPSETLNLEAWVAARCHLPSPGSTRQICCEQITVRWEGQGVQELPSVVIPLLVADLPVFLWWRAGSFNIQAIEPFLNSTDRLVVDTSRWDSSYLFFVDLNHCLQKYRKLMASDLNWARLTPWRRLLARAFDTAEVGLSLKDMQTITSVEILYAQASSSQAILLLSWLAAQLKWQPLSMKNIDTAAAELVFNQGARTIRAGWRSQPPNSVPGGAVAEVVLTVDGNHKLKGWLETQDNQLILTAETNINGQPKRFVLNGPDFNEAHLIDRELDMLEHDWVYEKAVDMAAKITRLASS